MERWFVVICCIVAAASATCPTVCHCVGNKVDCSNRGLLQIPADIPQNAGHLNLDQNKIKSISKSSFEGLKYLQALNLSYNSIRHIDEDAFQSTPAISHLYLYNNDIRTLHEHTFRGLSRLEILHMEENHLHSLPKDLFVGLRSLKYLSLFQNKITHLRNGVFRDLYNINCILLHQNELQTIGRHVFKNLHSLSYLYLFQNKLTQLKRETFKGLLRLQALYINKNQLSCDCSTVAAILAVQKIPILDGSCDSERLQDVKIEGRGCENRTCEQTATGCPTSAEPVCSDDRHCMYGGKCVSDTALGKRCSCHHGFSGANCGISAIQLQCLPDGNMRLSIDRHYFYKHFIVATLESKQCRAVLENSTQAVNPKVSLSYSEGICKTKTGRIGNGFVILMNKVTLQPKPDPNSIISRKSDVSIPLSCAFLTEENKTPATFTVHMAAYPNKHFVYDQQMTEYPAVVVAENNLFLEVDIATTALDVVVGSCYASSSPDREHHEAFYQFIEDECPADPTVVFHSVSKPGKKRFQLRPMRILGNQVYEKYIWIHCLVHLCASNSRASECKSKCPGNQVVELHPEKHYVSKNFRASSYGLAGPFQVV